MAQIYPSTFYPLEWLVSFGEDVPYKIGIRIFPHNQSGLIKSVLVGHTGISGLYLRATTTGVFRIPPGDLTRRDKWVIRTTFRIVPSRSGGTSSEDRLGVSPGPSRIFTQSSLQLSHLDVIQTPGTVRFPFHYTPEITSASES